MRGPGDAVGDHAGDERVLEDLTELTVPVDRPHDDRSLDGQGRAQQPEPQEALVQDERVDERLRRPPIEVSGSASPVEKAQGADRAQKPARPDPLLLPDARQEAAPEGADEEGVGGPVVGQKLDRGFGEPGLLELDVQGDVVEPLEGLAKRRQFEALLAGELPGAVERELPDAIAGELPVVVQDELVVGGGADVDLDRVGPVGERGLDRCDRVPRRAMWGALVADDLGVLAGP